MLRAFYARWSFFGTKLAAMHKDSFGLLAAWESVKRSRVGL